MGKVHTRFISHCSQFLLHNVAGWILATTLYLVFDEVATAA